MEGTTTDRRVRRTKARLRQALAQLLLEKDLSSITVRELTDLADVNRGTFYTHYRDLYDMLEQMEQEMFQELEDMLDSYASDILQQDITPILRDVFRFVGRNKDLCQVFLARQAVDRFSQRLNTLIVPQVPGGVAGTLSAVPEPERLADRARRGQLCPGVRGGRGGGPHPGLAGAGCPGVPGRRWPSSPGS